MELVHVLLLGTWEYFTHFLDIFHHFIIEAGASSPKLWEGAVRCGWASVASGTTLTLGQIKLKKLYYSRFFAHFLDPSISDLLQQVFCSFFGP